MYLQISLEVAVDLHTLLCGDKGLGINIVNTVEKLVNLKLGKTHREHADSFASVGAGAVPVGDAAVEGLHDVLFQPAAVVAGKDQRLHVDHLMVGAVQHRIDGEAVNDGIDGDTYVLSWKELMQKVGTKITYSPAVPMPL